MGLKRQSGALLTNGSFYFVLFGSSMGRETFRFLLKKCSSMIFGLELGDIVHLVAAAGLPPRPFLFRVAEQGETGPIVAVVALIETAFKTFGRAPRNIRAVVHIEVRIPRCHCHRAIGKLGRRR